MHVTFDACYVYIHTLHFSSALQGTDTLLLTLSQLGSSISSSVLVHTNSEMHMQRTPTHYICWSSKAILFISFFQLTIHSYTILSVVKNHRGQISGHALPLIPNTKNCSVNAIKANEWNPTLNLLETILRWDHTSCNAHKHVAVSSHEYSVVITLYYMSWSCHLIRQGGYVFTRVCLVVCWLDCQQDDTKTNERISTKRGWSLGLGLD